MRLLAICLALTLTSAAGFSALIDSVLSSPTRPAADAYTGNPNRDTSWVNRWTPATEQADNGQTTLPLK